MPSMTYCRHENTAAEMQQVWDLWEDYEPGSNAYEDKARTRIIRLVAQMHTQFDFDGSYDEVS